MLCAVSHGRADESHHMLNLVEATILPHPTHSPLSAPPPPPPPQGTTLNTETPGSPAPAKRIPHIHIPFIIPNPRQPPPSVVLPNTHHQAGLPLGPPLRPSSPAKPSSPQQPAAKRPVLETGEAGPPGFPRRMTVRRGVEDEAPVPLQGFAGAPGLCVVG